LQIALAITLLPWFAETFPGASPLTGVSLSDLWRDIYLAYALLSVLAALWLWTLSRRGWVLVMLLVGLGLIGNLALWFLNEPNWLRMAIQAVTAFYLNSAPVRELFERHDEVDTLVLHDSEPEAVS
jgi:hypothetical protein